MAGKENKYSPENAQVMKDIGNEAYGEENFKDALDAYLQALSLTPPDKIVDIAVIYFNIGVCYQKLKNNSDAKS